MRYVTAIPIQMILFLVLVIPTTVDGAESTSVVQPSDVYTEVDLVRQELDLLRWHFGRPKNLRVDIQVANAAPREVYFQALTLYKKAGWLAFEHIRKTSPDSTTPEGELQPEDVMDLVKTARQQLGLVLSHYGLQAVEQIRSPDPSKTPTDVFRSIVQANRQLDLLLDRRMAPSDVYQQVTLCINYTSNILATFPDAERLPQPPELEAGKRPQDVYGRLIDCFQLVAEIGRSQGETMLELSEESDAKENATPGDVFTLAALLVSELKFLHGKFSEASPRPAYYVGRKLPSDVYQRAGLLEKQLHTLLQQIEKTDS